MANERLIRISVSMQGPNKCRTVFNRRGIIINERFWNKLRNELIDIFKDQGPLILYQLGLSYGIEVGSQSREVAEDIVSATKFFEYYGLLAGWGRFEISELESLEGKIRVRIHDNFFAQAAKVDTGNPSCYFVSGLPAGMEEGHHCIEMQCISSGSKFCEFMVKRNPSR